MSFIYQKMRKSAKALGQAVIAAAGKRAGIFLSGWFMDRSLCSINPESRGSSGNVTEVLGELLCPSEPSYSPSIQQELSSLVRRYVLVIKKITEASVLEAYAI